ncbi:ribbon-helix-helix domain-containing protein [Pareuzebyella sediminis]|uniref:ribbon-helix-helix domain-containing protein n=1 Tax=Pareuzebyella sediminis TaxID=2607998 RepID=UPI0011EFF8AC|nr:ribbon-helix-helix domain-containing protein [Pareuzebyella sediminis]
MKTTINLRIDDDLKYSLQELADESGTSLSDYLREVLHDHLNGSFYEEGEEYSDGEEYQTGIEGIVVLDGSGPPIPFERTHDFLILVTWLFSKYMNSEDNNSIEVIQELKDKVEKSIHESSFSQELRLEFLKVLNDMNRFILEGDYPRKHFLFPIPGSAHSFNYYVLLNEIWSLKH